LTDSYSYWTIWFSWLFVLLKIDFFLLFQSNINKIIIHIQFRFVWIWSGFVMICSVLFVTAFACYMVWFICKKIGVCCIVKFFSVRSNLFCYWILFVDLLYAILVQKIMPTHVHCTEICWIFILVVDTGIGSNDFTVLPWKFYFSFLFFVGAKVWNRFFFLILNWIWWNILDSTIRY